MPLRARWRIWVNSVLSAGLLGGALAGCSNKEAATAVEVKPGDPKTPTVSVNGDASTAGSAETTAGNEVKSDKLHQSFADACTTEINGDSGVALPPTFTLTQKNTGQLNEAVQQLWKQIRFTTADGKRQTYVLSLELMQGDRNLGTIEILMQPELAPNHVRNFAALTMAGYFDGLRFDRIVKQQGEGESAAQRLVLLEAGSPAEDADPATSHLGYWVRPEFSQSVKHEEGTVGACLMQCEDNTDTAACRFYINLTAAPAMDGNFTIFGRVSKGIEIARDLSSQPVKDPAGGPDFGRPVTPIVIRKASARAVPVVE